MQGFDLAAVLITVAAISGYINHRMLKLPATTGTLAVALLSSLFVVAASAAFPAMGLRSTVAHALDRIDFNQILMRGMLSFLLFAGALHLDLEGLLDNKWTIGVMATIGSSACSRFSVNPQQDAGNIESRVRYIGGSAGTTTFRPVDT